MSLALKTSALQTAGFAEQIAHMIDTAARAFLRDFLIFGEECRQLELLQIMLQKQLRFVRGLRHAAARSSSAA